MSGGVPSESSESVPQRVRRVLRDADLIRWLNKVQETPDGLVLDLDHRAPQEVVSTVVAAVGQERVTITYGPPRYGWYAYETYYE